MRLRIRVPAAQRDLAVTMFKEMDSRFMHWVLQAILSWEPTPLEGIRVCQIHGARDLLIPAPAGRGRRGDPRRRAPDQRHARQGGQ